MQTQTIDRLHKLLAAGVLLFTFLIYNATKAPTLSFWDCGEFIACANILGIPHPPGAPLYVLIGRLFSIVPFNADIAARVNTLSTVSGAFAAMLAYLTTFRVIRWWWRREELAGWKAAAAFIGALVGSLLFAFSRTHWANSVEAEVYTVSMLLMMIVVWLLVRWIEYRDQPGADRHLYLITYVAFLSIGVHLTTFLIMPAVFLCVILYSPRLRRDVRFYVTGFCLMLIGHDFDYFLWTTAIWFIVVLVASLVRGERQWRFSLALILAAVIGFSCQLYTPIRSAEKPAINQNDPSSSYAAFQDFLKRRQYGQQSMLVRALHRRAEAVNQFGNFPRIGFWGFFSEQYGINGRTFGMVFVLGLLGLFEVARRKPKFGWPFVFMIILGTVFLILYMNFADGTRQNPTTGDGRIEVRDRDYFFTPGFILFGMAIGIGVAGLMEMARESLMGKSKYLRRPVLVLVALLVFLPVASLRANYHVCDRSDNYIPYDFAYNYLQSCDPDAILFIGGDNDTFPIWCLQEVYKFRTDVTVVNLALSNLDWYIRQIRDQKHIPLRFSDAQIAGMQHHVTQTGRRYRIQDQVLDEILNVVRWQRPIHFAITIPEGMRQYAGRSIEENLVMQGMVYRLEPGEPIGAIDLQKGYDLYFNKFSYRSIVDSTVYKDSRTLSLVGNYTTGLMLMADSLRVLKDYDEAIRLTEFANEIVPYENATINYLTQLYVESGRDSLVPELYARVKPDQVREIYFVRAMAFRYLGQKERSRDILEETLNAFPYFWDAMEKYVQYYYEIGDLDKARMLMEGWLARSPDDSRAQTVYREIMRRMSTPPAGTGDGTP